jgi:flagellar hook assembly protein FlgD
MTTGTTFTVKGRSLQTTKIEIFNSRGQLVKTLISGKGHSTRWNGTDNDGDRVYSGVYFYRLTTGKYSDTRKMILIL